MKKLFLAVLAFILVISLSACGDTTTTSQNPGAQTPDNPVTPVTPVDEPVSSKTPKIDDFWVSETEFDLEGYMKEFGFIYKPENQYEGHLEDNNAWFCHKSSEYGISIEYYGKGRNNLFFEIEILFNDMERNIKADGFFDIDENPTTEIKFTGHLSEFQPVPKEMRSNFIHFLELVPTMAENLENGHCPFHGTHDEIIVHGQGNLPDQPFLYHVYTDYNDRETLWKNNPEVCW